MSQTLISSLPVGTMFRAGDTVRTILAMRTTRNNGAHLQTDDGMGYRRYALDDTVDVVGRPDTVHAR